MQAKQQTLLSVLWQRDTRQTGRPPREPLRQAILQTMRFGFEQFVGRTLDSFGAEGSHEVQYEPLMDWLFASDADCGKLRLDAVHAQAAALFAKESLPAEQESLPAARRPSLRSQQGQEDTSLEKVSAQAETEDGDRWSLEKWLLGKVAPIVADVLKEPLAGDQDMEFAFARAVGEMEARNLGEGKQVVLDLLAKGGVLERLASQIANLAKELASTKVRSATELNEKFGSTEGTFELTVVCEADNFFSGLEDLVGSPNPNVHRAMASEHCDQDDSNHEWTTGSYGTRTTSETEWYLVVDPGKGPPKGGAWPVETEDGSHPRQPTPLSALEPTFDSINGRLEQPLSKEEWIGARYGMVENMCENLLLETRTFLGTPLWKNIIKDDEAAGAKIIEVVGEIAAAELKSVTAPAEEKPQLSNDDVMKRAHAFNDDVMLLSAMKRALAFSESVKWQACSILRRAADKLQGSDDDLAARITSTADEHEKVQWKEMASIEVTSRRLYDLGVFHDSPKEEILDRLMLVEQDGVMLVTSPCALWPEVKPNCKLASVDDLTGDPDSDLFVKLITNLLQNAGKATFVFHRPLEQEELEESLLGLLGSAAGGNIEETALLVGRCLAMNSNLSIVNLRNARLGPQACDALARAMEANRTVRSLVLGSNSAEVDLALALEKVLGVNQTLENLDVQGSALGADGGRAIANGLTHNTTLQTLRVRDTKLGKEGGRFVAEALETNKSLTILAIDDNDLGPKGAGYFATALQRNRTLGRLSMDNTSLGPAGGETIASVLRADNWTLHTLAVEGNEFGERGGLAFADMLRANKTLRVLYLDDNGLGPAACTAIADALEETAMTHLSLSTNGMGVNGGLRMAKALQAASCKLTFLNLQRNDLKDKGGVAIARALVSANRTLQLLSVADNGLGRNFAEAVAEVIRENPQLHWLGLSRNHIGPLGAEALAREVEGSPALAGLNVGSNDIGSQGGLALAAAMRKNRSLEGLDISDNMFNKEVGGAFAQALSANSDLRLRDFWISDSEIGEQAASSIRENLKNGKLHLL